MEVGISYSLEFFVGFRDNAIGSKDLNISIFASEFCNRLPFGEGSNTIGCPANTIFYDEINTQYVSGSNEWVSVTFEFTPSKEYEVIIIGPSCTPNPNYTHDPYFYLDGLTLAETSEFGVPFDDIEGSICNDDLILSIDEEDGDSYQWYKDGIALIGETGTKLSLVNAPDVAGNYLVVINYPEGCLSSKIYNVRVPPYYADQEATICENEEHLIETTSFTDDGMHEITIDAHDGCDSIITLTLNVDPTTFADVEDSFCEGDEYTLLDITTDQPGIFQTTLQNSNGCDSIITLDLSEIPRTYGFDMPSEVKLLLGDSINIIPGDYDPNIIEFTWYDSEGNTVGNTPNLIGIKPLNNSIYILEGKDKYGCIVTEEVSFLIDKSNTTIYLPNIFSPDENQINDYFSFIPTQALQSIETFIIYDRWGNQLYKDSPLTNYHDYLGWDGTYNGKEAAQGVYGYFINATFLDGTKKVFSGDLTLIRL